MNIHWEKIKKIKVSIFINLLLLLITHSAIHAQRVEQSLNHYWNFRLLNDNMASTYVQVDLPHTWNDKDALSGKNYYRGIGDYTKNIFIPAEWAGKRIFIRFEGALNVTHLFINAKFAGEHRGGYAAFIFEITNLVDLGKENTILVRVNNAERLDLLPISADFNFYGGLYRNVSLLLTDSVCISPLDYASSGVYLTQKNVSKKEAAVAAKVLVSNKKKSEQHLSLGIKILDGNTLVHYSKKDIVLPKNTDSAVIVPLLLKNPRLWNGVKDPFMYQVVVSLKKNSNEIDKVTQPLGLRFFSVDPNKGFFLNGNPIKLYGVCRHQDRAEVASALLPEHHDEDAALIKEIGANAVRLAHYQHAEDFYSLMDKLGLLVWAELPLIEPGAGNTKGFVNSPELRENIKEQLLELIRQNYNHPSIVMWGLYNEVKEYGDDPSSLIDTLNTIAHKEDSVRLTSGATNQRLTSAFHFIPDLLAWNKYYGWYEMPVNGLGNFLDNFHTLYPNMPIGISEYGAGASIYHHSDTLSMPKKTTDEFHPESWQTHVHIENWKVIKERQYVWGSFIWNMFDFAASARREGDRIGMNDKGLITFDRKVKKDAFYFYKANWNVIEKVLYIAEKRNTNRKTTQTNISVFTNLPHVILYVNKKLIAKASPDKFGIITWNNVSLQIGENHIEVQSKFGKKNYSDSCVWKVIP